MRQNRMVILLAIFFLLSPSSARAVERPHFLGEHINFEITFLKIPVVTADLCVSLDSTQWPEPIYHLSVTAKSTPFYSLLYPVNNRYDSYFTWPHMSTVQYVRCIQEPGVNRQQAARYQNGQAFYTGEEPRPVPSGVRDVFAALYALRDQPLEDGQVVESSLELDGQLWTAKATVLGREEIDIGSGCQRAIKVLIRFQLLDSGKIPRRESDVLTNNLIREKTKLILWFSDDPRKVPLRADYRMAPFSLRALMTAPQGDGAKPVEQMP